MKQYCRRRFALALCALTALGCGAAHASDAFPARPIRIIVPYPAGGVVDALARVVGEKLSGKYGQPVIVENRPGAGGNIGTEYVAKSPADGHTLLMVSPSFAVARLFQKSISWDPVRDFRGIACFGAIPNVIVVPPQVPARTLPEFLALTRSGKAPQTYASSGIGTSSFLAAELLVQTAHVPLTHVPYKGQPEATTDLLAGRVDMMPMSASLALPHIQAGKLRPLAVTTTQRAQALPDVPTVAEAARLPGYEVATWLGLLAPGKTPQPVLERLSEDVAAALALPDVKAKFRDLAIEGQPMKGPDFDRFVAKDVETWTRVVQQAGITPN